MPHKRFGHIPAGMLSTTYLANYHFLAFHGRTLTRWHQEALGNTDYFLLFDLQLLKHVPHRDTGTFDFLVVNRRLGPRIKVAVHKVRQ